MELEEMKRIAAARTKGEWVSDSDCDLFTRGEHEYIKELDDYQFKGLGSLRFDPENKNGKFIAMAANNWDYIFELASQCSFALDQLKKEQEVSQKMMAVVEAAKGHADLNSLKGCYEAIADLRKALEVLDDVSKSEVLEEN